MIIFRICCVYWGFNLFEFVMWRSRQDKVYMCLCQPEDYYSPETEHEYGQVCVNLPGVCVGIWVHVCQCLPRRRCTSHFNSLPPEMLLTLGIIRLLAGVSHAPFSQKHTTIMLLYIFRILYSGIQGERQNIPCERGSEAV